MSPVCYCNSPEDQTISTSSLSFGKETKMAIIINTFHQSQLHSYNFLCFFCGWVIKRTGLKLQCLVISCVQQWRTNVFGGPSSDAPHRLNEMTCRTWLVADCVQDPVNLIYMVLHRFVFFIDIIVRVLRCPQMWYENCVLLLLFCFTGGWAFLSWGDQTTSESWSTERFPWRHLFPSCHWSHCESKSIVLPIIVHCMALLEFDKRSPNIVVFRFLFVFHSSHILFQEINSLFCLFGVCFVTEHDWSVWRGHLANLKVRA